jgi:hypothetical protein
MDLTVLVSSFRQFVAEHPETKKLAFAKAIGTSPSGLSMILNGTNRPTARQALEMLNVVRGGSTRIVGLQENTDACDGNPHQRIALNDKNIAYLERFNRNVDMQLDTGGWTPIESGDDDPNTDNDGDPTTIRKAGDEGTDDPSLENVFAQLDRLYRVIGKVLATQTIKRAVPNKTGSTGRNTPQKFSTAR